MNRRGIHKGLRRAVLGLKVRVVAFCPQAAMSLQLQGLVKVAITVGN